eukprot:CAMPEP_0194213856 /NCGR_PEP_ID=MMETSP0156-20130528/14726_1 /TAXON_ID=33649 /ORGANISM="Thalassionema nitzschioides, Strain L26-B" /LENGTH=67 /DNA_ID=CAMNT_0038941985 /DNA_START=270 /DNA_END=473 /DNA_ORIENTATION=+
MSPSSTESKTSDAADSTESRPKTNPNPALFTFPWYYIIMMSLAVALIWHFAELWYKSSHQKEETAEL